MATSTIEPSVAEARDVARPDRSWCGLYRAGRVSAILFVLCTIAYSVVAAVTQQPRVRARPAPCRQECGFSWIAPIVWPGHPHTDEDHGVVAYATLS
jgi:hypothetical protein